MLNSAIIQLVHAPVNEKFHKEPAVYAGMLETQKKIKGVVSIHYGQKVDDPNTHIAIGCLESYESTVEFRRNSGWTPLIHTAMSLCTAPFKMVHIPGDATQVLSGPIVAVSTMDVRPDGDMQAVLDVLNKYEELAKQTSDYKGGVIGSTLEDINKVISISSWSSQEAHETFAKKPECVALGQQMHSMVVGGGNEYVKITKA